MVTAFCLDLDGTITTEEILPRLAREVDLFDEMAVLTEATLKGVLAFERSFKLRCRLLSGIPVSRVQRIVEAIEVDYEIESFMRQNKQRCFIATGNLDVWIAPLAKRLECRTFASTAITAGDNLTGVAEVLDKAHAVREVRKQFERVVAIGDGMNDAAMFEVADVGVAFGGVHDPAPTLIDLAGYVVMNGRALCRLLNTL